MHGILFRAQRLFKRRWHPGKTEVNFDDLSGCCRRRRGLFRIRPIIGGSFGQNI